MRARLVRRSRARLAGARGQMTVELAVVFPVAIIIAVIAVNACTFFSECASFDRVSRNAVRIVAASPAYAQDQGQAADRIRQMVDAQMGDACSAIEVTAERSGECIRYTVSMRYAPSLFGMGLRESVLGVRLPELAHETALSVIPYKPGMLL